MDYDARAQATAARMLAPKASGGKGMAVTLSVTTAGDYDPATGAPAAGTTATQTGTGIEEAFKAHEIDGSVIKVGDVKFLLSPLTTAGAAVTTAVVGATVTYADARKWRVQGSEPFAPAGTTVFSYLHLRRS